MLVKLENTFGEEFIINTDKIVKVNKGNPKSTWGYDGDFCVITCDTGWIESVKGTIDEVVNMFEEKQNI